MQYALNANKTASHKPYSTIQIRQIWSLSTFGWLCVCVCVVYEQTNIRTYREVKYYDLLEICCEYVHACCERVKGR